VEELTCNAIREFRLAHHPQTPGELLDQPVLLFASVVFFSLVFFSVVFLVCFLLTGFVPGLVIMYQLGQSGWGRNWA
jgi:hypothetical protein